MAWISACAVGSDAAIGRFQPSPTISFCKTTTAPIGTSPSPSARRASSSARRIYCSSSTRVILADGIAFFRAQLPLPVAGRPGHLVGVRDGGADPRLVHPVEHGLGPAARHGGGAGMASLDLLAFLRHRRRPAR